MAKKIIISILILLILISLGIIGYIVISQNPNLSLAKFSFFTTKNDDQIPKIPANFFPQATGTTDIFINTSRPSSSTTASLSEIIKNNPNLAAISALGLTLLKETQKERVLFVDKSTGNFYEISDQNELLRLTNETILEIGEVYWGKDNTGERVILRSSSAGQITNLNSLIKNSTNNAGLSELTSQVLSSDIKAIVIAPNKTKFFTLETAGDGIIGYLNDWTGKNKQKIWSFPFGDWQVAWPKDNIVSLTTTPSGNDSGYLYFLNPTTGTLTKILKGVTGLTTKVSPSGQKLIFSRHNSGKLSLYLYEIDTKKTSSVGLNTLPEKCLWADDNTLYCAVPRSIPSGLYPDDWYQGKITFTDDIWKIDTKQKTVILLVVTKGSYDLVNLIVAPKRGWLYAINKPDNSIQSFSLPLE